MSSTNAPIRQGDILIVPAGTPRFDGRRTIGRPHSCVEANRDGRGRLVLAEGETTGHCHAIVDDTVTMFLQGDLDEMSDRFLAVEREAELVHEEHATVVIPAGEHIVRRKREYEPEAPRYVAD